MTAAGESPLITTASCPRLLNGISCLRPKVMSIYYLSGKMSVRQLGTTLSRRFTTSATCQRSFTISFKMPRADGDTETETYESAKSFRETFHGFRFTNPQTGKTYRAAELPTYHTDPTVVYTAKHPFLTTRLEEHSHTQITDKAFEDNACAALERHLQSRFIQRRIPDNPHRPGGWRFLTLPGGKDIAEWEGIWESSDGHVFFLEAKHLMSFVSFSQFRGSVSISYIFIYRKNSRKLKASLRGVSIFWV